MNLSHKDIKEMASGKTEERLTHEQIAADTEQFLANGGQIEQIPYGEYSDQELNDKLKKLSETKQ